jgi:hypothetical protein
MCKKTLLGQALSVHKHPYHLYQFLRFKNTTVTETSSQLLTTTMQWTNGGTRGRIHATTMEFIAWKHTLETCSIWRNRLALGERFGFNDLVDLCQNHGHHRLDADPCCRGRRWWPRHGAQMAFLGSRTPWGCRCSNPCLLSTLLLPPPFSLWLCNDAKNKLSGIAFVLGERIKMNGGKSVRCHFFSGTSMPRWWLLTQTIRGTKSLLSQAWLCD